MAQLNIHMTSAFEQDLRRFMKLRHIPTKAEAVRTAIKESLERSTRHIQPTNFYSWIGLAKQISTNKKSKFHSDDDLWG